MSCKNCVFVTSGTTCPQCNETVYRSGEDFFILQNRIYGCEAIPKYDEGLGVFTRGKTDTLRQAAEQGYRHKEKGESRRWKSRHEYWKANRPRIRPTRESISIT